MSIYCSMEGIDAECGKPSKNRPLQYQGSHVLPRDRDKRAGSVDLAYIPPHITRNGKDTRSEDAPIHPWLRLGVSVDNYACRNTVILTRIQVEKLREQLDWWLKASQSEEPK